MDSLDMVIQDIIKARADAIERMLKANGITEETGSEGFELVSKYNADGTETVELCKLVPVQSVTFGYTVEGNKTTVHIADAVSLDEERAKRDKPKDN